MKAYDKERGSKIGGRGEGGDGKGKERRQGGVTMKK